MKKIISIAVIVVIIGGGIWLWYRFNPPGKPIADGITVVDEVAYSDREKEITPVAEVQFKVEPYISGLFVPWGLVWTADNRILVTERNGNIRVILDNVLQDTPLYTFPEVSTQSEEGLMGIALDPDYASNKYIYVCVAYPQSDQIYDKVVRFTDIGTQLTDETIILDKIPAARFHAGCRVKFGPDQKLYITTGDASNRQLAQTRESLAGKILRINSDGTIPEDNPYQNNPIWSYGHRNPQGIDWHESGALWSSEHGPSGNDGPRGGDEVNRIIKGENYGWPLVSHNETKEDTQSPRLVFTPAFPPGSATFYNKDVFPQFKNNLFIGGLGSESMLRVILSLDGESVSAYERIASVSVGRIREISVGPDGLLYFTTSNRDGRGTPRDGDDHIYRLVPAN